MGLRDLAARQRRAIPDIRLQVKNLTRQTVLADCVEVAGNSAKRSKGLLGRKGLSPGEGLWILPCESVHTFGMQFSIDLVYVDRKHRIRKLRSNVPPWRISACFSAHSVIELPSGTIRQTQCSRGDTLEFSATPLENDDSMNNHSTHSQSLSPLHRRMMAEEWALGAPMLELKTGVAP